MAAFAKANEQDDDDDYDSVEDLDDENDYGINGEEINPE